MLMFMIAYTAPCCPQLFSRYVTCWTQRRLSLQIGCGMYRYSQEQVNADCSRLSVLSMSVSRKGPMQILMDTRINAQTSNCLLVQPKDVAVSGQIEQNLCRDHEFYTHPCLLLPVACLKNRNGRWFSALSVKNGFIRNVKIFPRVCFQEIVSLHGFVMDVCTDSFWHMIF